MTKDRYLLTAVVPVSAMANKLQNFMLWVDKSPAELRIIVVHDWRDSATGEELRKIIEGKANVDFIEGKFGSPGAARNAGLERVKTEWTVFWDSDDLPNVSATLTAIEKSNKNTDMIITSFSVKSLISNKTIRESHSPVKGIKNQLEYLANDPGIWRIIFRTKNIVRLVFPEIMIGEDVKFISDALDNCHEILFLHDLTYTYYRDVQGQLTADHKHIFEIIPLIESLDKHWQSSEAEKYFVVPLIVKQYLSYVKHSGFNMETTKKLIRSAPIKRHTFQAFISFAILIFIRFREKIKYKYNK
jgi:hypothetical protein